MSAEVPIWVEVEVPRYVWLKTYAVTRDHAVGNVASRVSNRLTGETSYEYPGGECYGLETFAQENDDG